MKCSSFANAAMRDTSYSVSPLSLRESEAGGVPTILTPRLIPYRFPFISNAPNQISRMLPSRWRRNSSGINVPFRDMFGVQSQAMQHPEHYESSRTSGLQKTNTTTNTDTKNKVIIN